MYSECNEGETGLYGIENAFKRWLNFFTKYKNISG